MCDSTKQQSNPFSTGGGGGNFETRVQAAFIVLMLTGKISPCLPAWPIVKLKLQGHYAGFNIDDFIAFVQCSNTGSEAKLLAQIKYSISITEGDTVFGEVIQAAWHDFNNASIFTVGIDALALITGPLSATDIKNTRMVLEWARHSEDEKEFLEKVSMPNFSSDAKRNKLQIFRVHLKNANGGMDVSDEQLWRFLKGFHILGYDLDTETGICFSLIQSLIAQNSSGNPAHLWSRIIDVVQSYNQNAGTLSLNNIPDDIRQSIDRQNLNWNVDIKKLKDHEEYIVKGIRSNIGGVHIKRADCFEQLVEISEIAEFVFVSGARGCGKSGLVQEFVDYMKERAPVFCFRAEDFDKAHLDNVFSSIGLISSLSNLEAGFALMPKKYLILESIEKVLELQYTNAFTDLLQFVRQHSDWTIIASGRDYAYQPIVFNLLQPSGIKHETLIIESFSEAEVDYLCDKLEYLRPLSTNQSIKTLIQNPFFAELAYRVCAGGGQFSIGDSEHEFRTIVWRHVIVKEQERINGLPSKRRKAFIDIAVQRAKKMIYGVPAVEFDPDALLKLEEDNLIRREYQNDLVSLSHDVLEDWALERYIEDIYQVQVQNVQEFLERIGHEPAMNRAFRLWLHQKMRYGDDVTQFILAILHDENIAKCWQDETISAILHDDNSGEFLSSLKEKLFDKNGEMLKRFCFILRISCKIPDQQLMKLIKNKDGQALNKFGVLYLKPYGGAWETIIDFLYVNKNSISNELFPHIIEVLYEWSLTIHIDKELPAAARNAGLLALHLLTPAKDSYEDEGGRKKLLGVIIKVVPQISVEFNNMLEEDIFSTYDKGQRFSYVDDFCNMALVEMDTAFLCKNQPDTLVKLALNEWIINETKEDKHLFYRGHKDVEECFGIHKYGSGSDFFPASGLKGPFRCLLRYHPRKGLDFILKLLNITAEKYAVSGLDTAKDEVAWLSALTVQSELEKVEIHLNDGTTVKQYCSGRMWAGYRGITVLPYLLQSALMALENWLIDLIQSSQLLEIVEWVFDYVLRQSNSVMPTAVLASVATGFPEKLRKSVYPFLQTPEFYELDLMRTAHERGGNEPNWHNSILNREALADLYSEERRTAALRAWRKEHLEKVIVYHQFTDLREDMLSFIDDLRLRAPSNETWRFRFHRIDSRGWKPVEDKDNNRILFSPAEIESDLKALQEETQEQMAMTNRFIRLYLWSDKVSKKEALDQAYYADMNEVLVEAKELYSILSSGNASEVAKMQYGGIVKAAAILLKEYASEMSEEDLLWSIGLVNQAVLFNTDADDMYSAEDKMDIAGSATAASILPILLDFTRNDEDVKAVRKLIVTALTHGNETVKIEAANGIREHLWQRDAAFAQRCIIGMLEYSRLVMEDLQSNRKSFRIPSNEKIEANIWLANFRIQFSGEGTLDANIDKITFQSHTSRNILLSCVMIPDGSINSTHVLLLSRIITLLSEEENIRNEPGRKNKRTIDYELPGNFAKRFAAYLLSLSDQDQIIFVEQLQHSCDIAPDFMHWILLGIALHAERTEKKEVYWRIWGQLSQKAQEIALSLAQEQDRYRRHDKRTKLIRSMLYVDTPWQKIDYENQEIGFGKDLILDFVKNAGSNPDVFEAMASLMYHFPAIFFEAGLQVTARYLQEIDMKQLFSGVNTSFYLERALQIFLLMDNTTPLSYAVHRDCCILLDAIIETASSGAYYLREHLIRSRRIAAI